MIAAVAAGVHFEDRLASAKKCGHMGGKVLVPPQESIQKLVAARLAADISGVPTVLIASTDANSASLLTGGVDLGMNGSLPASALRKDSSFTVAASKHQPREVWHTRLIRILCGARCRSRTSRKPASRRRHPQGIPGQVAGVRLLAFFQRTAKLNWAAIAKFRRELGPMGYKFRFVTLAGFH
jgi:isocitrate lyase